MSSKIPFSLPLLDEDVAAEVNDIFKNTGWITSGPKVKEFEVELKKLTQAQAVICTSTWTSGAMTVLRWFGIGKGDEVIVPAYTYSATALSVLNMGGTPVMVDVGEDFNISAKNIESAITKNTKAIIPVDIGGWPCDFDSILKVATSPKTKEVFNPQHPNQKKLGRPLILVDAAHSIGAFYKGIPSGSSGDISVFSFHSVKNVTTGEGGAICLNLPSSFDPTFEEQFFRKLILNGQTKSAFEKNQLGGWKYDIIDQGLKANMPDLCAAVGLAQIRKYEKELLPERKKIFEVYDQEFKKEPWAILPTHHTNERTSSYHVYLLRIKGMSEQKRDELISELSTQGINVNVHFIPMPMLTLFKKMGFKIENYPMSYKLYENEISLPVYNGLSSSNVLRIAGSIKKLAPKFQK